MAARIQAAQSTIEAVQNTIVEELLAEFNEGLRSEGRARFEVLQRCPEEQKRELLALMNVATLAYRALEPDRQALHATKKRKIAL